MYRSMLSNILDVVDGHRVGEHPKVIRLLKGVFNRRPPKKSLVPEWDLNLVLKALRQAPFEPLADAHPKCVAFKLAFLLAVTTARRVSDISHLKIGDHCRVQRDRITFLPAKLAKADDPGHFLTPIVVPAFPRDQRLCVVRTLKFYLRVTADRREGRDPKVLLRSLVRPFNPVSSQTVSNWITRTIKMAYEIRGRPHPARARAHSVRALAPNWAAFKGVSLERILAAADWRRRSTFAKFYLRDLSEQRSAFGTAVLSAADLPPSQ